MQSLRRPPVLLSNDTSELEKRIIKYKKHGFFVAINISDTGLQNIIKQFGDDAPIIIIGKTSISPNILYILIKGSNTEKWQVKINASSNFKPQAGLREVDGYMERDFFLDAIAEDFVKDGCIIVNLRVPVEESSNYVYATSQEIAFYTEKEKELCQKYLNILVNKSDLLCPSSYDEENGILRFRGRQIQMIKHSKKLNQSQGKILTMLFESNDSIKNGVFLNEIFDTKRLFFEEPSKYKTNIAAPHLILGYNNKNDYKNEKLKQRKKVYNCLSEINKKFKQETGIECLIKICKDKCIINPQLIKKSENLS